MLHLSRRTNVFLANAAVWKRCNNNNKCRRKFIDNNRKKLNKLFLPATQQHFSFSSDSGKKLSPNEMYVREREKKNRELDELAAKSMLKWKIQGGVLCSRPPVITPDVEEWEERYHHLVDKKERAAFSVYERALYPRMKSDIDDYLVHSLDFWDSSDNQPESPHL